MYILYFILYEKWAVKKFIGKSSNNIIIGCASISSFPLYECIFVNFTLFNLLSTALNGVPFFRFFSLCATYDSLLFHGPQYVLQL